MERHSWKRYLVTVAAYLALAGCKYGVPNATTKSLDNFAQGRRATMNQCKGDPRLANDKGLQLKLAALKSRVHWSTANAAAEPAMLQAVNDGFSALPPSVQNMFLTLNGQIFVTKDANAICTDYDRTSLGSAKAAKQAEVQSLKEGLDAVAACYAFLLPQDRVQLLGASKSGDKGQLLTVIVKDDAAEIHHGLVRVFGYMNSQLGAHLAVSDASMTAAGQAVAYDGTENPTFVATKQRIATAFLQDLKGRPEYVHFAKFANGTASSQEQSDFDHFVYAEAFDSYFCNQVDSGDKNTFKLMAAEFPRTFKAFSESLASNASGAVVQSALALTARPHAGGFALADANTSTASSGLWGPLAATQNLAMGTANWISSAAASTWNGTASAAGQVWDGTKYVAAETAGTATELYQGASAMVDTYQANREKIIEQMTQQIADENQATTGDGSVSPIQYISIGANAAYRPLGQGVPVLGGVIDPAIKATDAFAGATIDAQTGAGRDLDAAEQQQLGLSAGLDVALSQVPVGKAVDSLGGAVGAKVLGKEGLEMVKSFASSTPVTRFATGVVQSATESVAGGILDQGRQVVEGQIDNGLDAINAPSGSDNSSP